MVFIYVSELVQLILLYPRIHVVYKGYIRNQRVVGRSVGRAVGRSVGCQSCVANYFLSFWPILMKFSTDVCLGV